MRVLLTGATGFIGSALARRLRDRGDEVVAYVRNPDKANDLASIGCQVVKGELLDGDAFAAAAADADAVIHAAAVYEIGIPASERKSMFDTNVTGTETVLDAAIAAGVRRIVYVSTVGAFGNTRGLVADEDFQHSGKYVSYYDETKHLAHVAAERRIAEGAPIVVVQPSVVYGPGDHSSIGSVADMFLKRRLPAIAFPDMGFSAAYIDDVVEGLVAALDKGRLGEHYVLSGENVTMRQFVETLAEVAGRRAPRFDVPTPALRAMTPLGPLVGKAMKQRPNLAEIISASDGVTYWARYDKARSELGYEPRPLATGLKDLLRAEGRL